MRPLPLAAIKPRSRTPLAKRSRGDQAAAGALGCRAVIREVAPGGTYTSAPMLVCSSVYPVLRSTSAPERDVLRRSPSTGCVVRLGYHTCAPLLHSAQILAPAESILPALMYYAGCTYFGIRQYVSPFAQYTSLGASGPSPSTITSRHGQNS